MHVKAWLNGNGDKGGTMAMKGHNNYIIKTKSMMALVVDNTQNECLQIYRVSSLHKNI
uniref:Uncharacterized protein n=1 Tax=Romanomermis culicivorax TaxID=13658 RepID=A0A915JFW0_ROMCU